MKLKSLFALFILLIGLPAFAQEWAADSLGSTEYNCFLVEHIIGDFGDETYVLQNDEPVTVEEMILQLASGCKTASAADSDLAYLEIIRSWPFIYYDENTYQCDTVDDIVADYGNYEFQRSDDDALTVFTYHQKKAPYCLPRYVIAEQNIHLRECLDRPCETGQYMLQGEVLPVVGIVVDGDEQWYEVAREFEHYLYVDPQDETAFVYAADVVPGPAGFIELDGDYAILHEDHSPLCRITTLRGDESLLLLVTIKSGPAYEDMQVDIYKPFSESSLKIMREVERNFKDSGLPYFNLVYDWTDHGSKLGIYTIELTLDSITYRFGINLTDIGVYSFLFHCK